MEEKEYIYREINPHDEEDFDKYLILRDGLCEFLKSTHKPFTEIHKKWTRIRMGATELLPEEKKGGEYEARINSCPDEMVFVCEIDNEVIGFIQISTYHLNEDDERVNDDIGIIGEIFVKPEYRKQDISLQLLKLGVQKLIESGKFRAICNVQQDNKYRYLHFAMAEGNVIRKNKCKRKDGSETVDYTLMIDVKKLNEDLLNNKFVRRIGKYHLKVSKELCNNI